MFCELLLLTSFAYSVIVYNGCGLWRPLNGRLGGA